MLIKFIITSRTNCHAQFFQTFSTLYTITMKNAILLLSFTIAILNQRDFLQYRLAPNQLSLPIFNFCNKYQLMIDTGSDQVWLADDSCRNCPKTMSFCPYLKQSRHQIDYFLGDVKGDFAALNTCLGITQFFCVKQAHFFDNLNSHGILGINKNSTGKAFITKFFQINKINLLSVSFVLLKIQKKLIFGEVPEKYKKGSFYIQNMGWGINTSGMSYDGHVEAFGPLVGYFDSGSNMLVLPEDLYKLIQSYIRSIMHRSYCRDQSEQKLTFKCEQQIDLQQKISFMIDSRDQQKNSSISIQLAHLLQVKGNIYFFGIQKTKENKIIFGFNTFRGYVISFDLSGKLKIYESRFDELVSQEKHNFSIVLLEYLLAIWILSMLANKVQQLVNQNINKKIVI